MHSFEVHSNESARRNSVPLRMEQVIRKQQEKVSSDEQSKQIRAKFQAKAVLGFWELTPMESGADD